MLARKEPRRLSRLDLTDNPLAECESVVDRDSGKGGDASVRTGAIGLYALLVVCLLPGPGVGRGGTGGAVGAAGDDAALADVRLDYCLEPSPRGTHSTHAAEAVGCALAFAAQTTMTRIRGDCVVLAWHVGLAMWRLSTPSGGAGTAVRLDLRRTVFHTTSARGDGGASYRFEVAAGDAVQLLVQLPQGP